MPVVERDLKSLVHGLPDVAFNRQAILPLELIRDHTKTNDIVTVSDAQLKLYAKSALETAEAYTGMILTKKRSVQEPVELPSINYAAMQHGNMYGPENGRKMTFTFKAAHTFADGIAYFFGGPNQVPQQIGVQVGGRTVELPMIHSTFGFDCCSDKVSNGTQLMYYAGFACEDDIPATIVIGCLKYIAHLVENPGDVTYGTTAAGNTGGDPSKDAANPIVASGAIELWNVANREAYIG